MSHENGVIDYSQAFPNALLAQGNEDHFLALYRLDDPFKRADGKSARYELHYRWLSQECQREDDQSWACVQGSELTYWQRNEIDRLMRTLKERGEANLFEHFFLF